MKHESAGVRRAVLSHLTDVLRVHRSSFRRFLEVEQHSSMRFLTVISNEVDSGEAASTLMSTLMFSLLSRCVHETDQVVRQMLSVCLGELGAVDPCFLSGDISTITKTAGATSDNVLEMNDMHHLWRLNHPPWKSHEHEYELILVSNHLVVALKAAPTTQDQHKVAFAIQEIMSSLELFSRTNLLDENIQSSKDEPRQKKEISKWLRNQLSEANVLEVIEPFAFTNYKQQNFSPSKKPLRPL